MNGFAQVEVGEYERRTVPASPPTPADQRLADHLGAGGEGEARLAVRWLVSGEVDIHATSWVGVVQFSNLRVSVVPKLVGGSLQVLRMLEYAAGVSILRRLPAERPFPPGGPDLFDLICLLLTEEARVLVRDGLLRDYRPASDTLDVLRGRLRYRDQMLRRFGQLDRIHCDYDEYDTDNPDNQFVTAALHVARRRSNDPDVRFAALRLAGIYDEVCAPPTSHPGHYRQVVSYNRRNERYRPAHELSSLVLEGTAFEDLYDTASGRISAFMLDMNSVFERFVTRLVDDALRPLPELRNSSQLKLRAVIRNDDTWRTYSTLRPDLVIEDIRTGERVPIDIKYKLYDTRKLNAADIYQTFMYAFALGTQHRRRAGLIYPSRTHRAGPALSIRPLTGPVAARIAGLGIDVPAILDALNGPRHNTELQHMRDAIGQLTAFESAAVGPPVVTA